VKPRLQFEETLDADVISNWGRSNERQTPRVRIEVECDHDDVEAGLAALDASVANIRAQFERVKFLDHRPE
jgi:hypothetical protein